MADTKSYIVQYQITADASKAEGVLKKFSTAATNAQKPIQTLADTISMVAVSMREMAAYSNLQFKPTIQIEGFKTTLAKMVLETEKAAAQMKVAIHQAFAGDKISQRIVKKAGDSVFGGYPMIKNLENDIKQAEKQLANYKNLGRKLTAQEREEKSRATALIKAKEADLKAAKHLEDKYGRDADNKSNKNTGGGSKTNNKKPPVTNVKVKDLQAYSNFFGGKKSKTFTIRVKAVATGANGALDVINKVKAALGELPGLSAFTINPAVNPQAFDKVKSQLNELAALQNKVTGITGKKGGLTVKETEKLKKAQEAVKKANSDTAPILSRLKANTAIPEEDRTRAQKAQITKDRNKLKNLRAEHDKHAEVGKRLRKKSIVSSAPLTVTPSTPIIPPPAVNQSINLDLNIAPAQTKLGAFIAEVRAASPQTISLTARGMAPLGPYTPTVPFAPMGAPSATSTTPAPVATSGRSSGSASRTKKGKPSSGNVQKANKLMAQAQEGFLPFKPTSAELKSLVKYRKYFWKAARVSGINPVPDLPPNLMLPYLQSVQALMQGDGVAIPAQLQTRIGKLQNQMFHSTPRVAPGASDGVSSSSLYKSRGYVPTMYGAKSAVRTEPLDSRLRRATYPFTGNTSFGARTPMAVEMAKGMGFMYALSGGISMITDSFKQATEYQNLMTTADAILQHGTSNYTVGGFKDMEKTVRNVGVKTKFSAPEVASAAKFLAMAGYDIDAINSTIRPVTELALLGDHDLGETADKMTNILTTFGVSADKIHSNPEIVRQFGNIMATTATHSNTDLMMLAESAKYGGGVAKMFGGNDPNLFADTMAIFGVMGNAGVQGSSAGTALRMMYLNLAKPNKNQKKTIDELAGRGVHIYDSNNNLLPMSQILMEMANKIPVNEQARIISNLFRITALPGANAALKAAIMEEAGGDQNLATQLIEQSNNFIEALGKGKLSSLASLIMANRASVNGDILSETAEAKQNTLQGLWAQVTSMFTEAVTQAMENRLGGFEEILKKVRDFLALPSTVETLQNIIDMVVDIIKLMGRFAQLWVGLYQSAPGLVKTWVVLQLFFTQLGSLIAPFTALISVFSRIKAVLNGLGGLGFGGGLTGAAGGAGGVGSYAASAAIAGAGGVAGKKKKALVVPIGGKTRSAVQAVAIQQRTAMKGQFLSGKASPADLAPFYIMSQSNWFGKERRVNATDREKMRIYTDPILLEAQAGIRQADAEQARILAKMQSRSARTGYRVFENGSSGHILWNAPRLNHKSAQIAKNRRNYENLLATRRSELQQHAIDVRQRAKRIYSPKGRFNRSFKAARAFNLGLNAATLKPMVTNLGKSLVSGLGTALGALTSPAALATASIGALAFGIYKLNQYAKGDTKGQQETRQRIKENSQVAIEAEKTQAKWYTDQVAQLKQAPITPVSSLNWEYLNQIESNVKGLRDRYSLIFSNIDKNASAQSNQQVVKTIIEQLNANPLNSFAFGTTDMLSKVIGRLSYGLGDYREEMRKSGKKGVGSMYKYKQKFRPYTKARELKSQLSSLFMTTAGVNMPEVQEALAEIREVNLKYREGKIKQEEYDKVVKRYQSLYNPKRAGLRSAANLSPEEFGNALYDPLSYYEAVAGVYNVIANFINGTPGTLTAYDNAIYDLTNNKVKVWTDTWYKSISNVISYYPVILQNLTTLDGKRKDVEVSLSLLPNGKLNMTALVKQIQDQIGAFTTNIAIFSDGVAAVYKTLAEKGLVPGDKNSLNKFVSDAIDDVPITKQFAEQYWDSRIANDPNSRWHKWKFTREKYANLVSKPGNYKMWGTTSQRERATMKYNVAKDAANAALDGQPEITKENPKNTTDTSPSASGKQDDYANSYDKGVAKPTAIAFNIENLCNFGEMNVSSSAEERDMMAAMEGVVTNAVYQIFAEAASQANSYMESNMA